MQNLHSAAFATAFLIVLLFSFTGYCQTGTSSWVRIGANGKLEYTPDAKGNTLPDFSMVGYKSGQAIPNNVPVVKTMSAIAGDNLARIQAAIDSVSGLAVDGNGFRGAILLKKGDYEVSNTLKINASGVVLRGEGAASGETHLIATRTAQHTLIAVAGPGTPAEVAGSRKKITDTYVPVGAKSFTVESAAAFAEGDEIILRIEPKDSWITLLNVAQYGWTASYYRMSYVRTITKIEGNKVYIDAPVVDPIDVNYKDGYIYKYTWSKIENVAVEDIRFSSVYSGTEDENHGWTAISIDKARHCWVRNCNFYYFGYSAVYVLEWGVNVSVLNCQNRDPISVTTGGRKYSFNLNGQLTLFKDCYTHSGRHDYVTGSTTSGPNAFVRCKADNMRADIGPHHRWATGLLFDNVVGSGEQNVQNRGTSGSGHGWAGAQTLFWNCTGSRFRNQKPPEHLNWAIGCKGTVTDDGNYIDGNPGIWESTGNFITIESLYEQQLQDKMGGSSVCVPVAASADDGNVAGNVLDNDLSTRWAADGNPQWIQLCLGSKKIVNGVKIAFYKGNEYTSTFDVILSPDSINWETVAAGLVSNGTSLAVDTFNFADKIAKYVRIVGHGNSVNTLNSYTEVGVTYGPTRAPYGGTVRNIPGKIEAEHYDVGGQGVSFFDTTPGNSGNIFRTDNVDVQTTTDVGGGYNIGFAQPGEWMEYTVNVQTEAAYKLELRVSATATGKTMHVQLDGEKISGTVSVPNTGNFQTFATVTVTTPVLTPGKKIMRIVMETSSFNLNYVTFSITQTPYTGTAKPIPGQIETEQYDRGGEDIAYHDLSSGNAGQEFRTDDVDIYSVSSDTVGYNIGSVQAGEWLEYSVNITTASYYKIETYVAAAAAGKTFHIEMDGQNISGPISIPNTGSISQFQMVTDTTSASITTGSKVMRIVMDSPDFSISYVKFTAVTLPTPTVVGTEDDYAGILQPEVYPNPFTNDLLVKFFLKEKGKTTLTVYDAMGRKIGVPLDEEMQPGTHEARIDGSRMTSGIYVLKLFHKNRSSTQILYKK